jgi:nitrous oxidase accessory protein NosD
MKALMVLLVFILLLIPTQTGSAGNNSPENVVSLTADKVAGANDIEAAIIEATAEGTRPGTVILDGSHGPFVFTTDDRSLNIFVSNLTLRGVSLATIENCDDGLFFDNFPYRDILVEGIIFSCTGDGVETNSSYTNVILRRNVFRAGSMGVSLHGNLSDWLITGNLIEASGNGIEVFGAKKFSIVSNHISGTIGINLNACTQFQVKKNTLHAAYQGVLLSNESWKNRVQMNIILGVTQSGVSLEPGVTGNLIMGNIVLCAPGADCVPVDASPEEMKANTIVLTHLPEPPKKRLGANTPDP